MSVAREYDLAKESERTRPVRLVLVPIMVRCFVARHIACVER